MSMAAAPGLRTPCEVMTIFFNRFNTSSAFSWISYGKPVARSASASFGVRETAMGLLFRNAPVPFAASKSSSIKGFKTTPMDFLILIIALVVPNLPDEQIRGWQMGLVAAKIIVLFFTYEIIKSELRLDTKKLEITGIIALLVISIRGMIG